MIFWPRCMTENLPLAGMRIVVTRPREQAVQLMQGIEKLGGACIQFPLLEITPLPDNEPLRALAARLQEYQLAIFVSPNAVRYAMKAIQSTGGLPASLQIATVGLGSARLLHEYGVAKVIAPQQGFDSESLLALAELQDVRDKRVVIFRGDSGREVLGDTLKMRGADVDYATCYRRSTPQLDVVALLSATPDALSVSSSEALNNLWNMSNETDRQQLITLPLFVSHARIAAAAHKLGWQSIISTDGGDEGLLSGLLTWAARKTYRGTQ